MFYATRIQSIENGFAIDEQGKSLRFIGYLPVKEGDTVYTDGNIIFGNATPRGGVFIPDVSGGIPVIGSVPVIGSELRGYFTPQGKFKAFKIKGDKWLTNDKKVYEHEQGNSDIIDAEISDDGALYTVEKKITQIAEDDNDPTLFYYYYSNYYMLWQQQRYFIMMDLERRSRGTITNVVSHSAWWTMTDTSACDYIKNQTPIIIQGTYGSTAGTQTLPQFIDKGDDAIIRDCELTIKKDGKEIATLRLSKLVEPAEQAAMDYVNVTVPNMSFKEYIKSRAKLLNFKITPDGKWTALFLIEIGAERDYPNPDGNLYETVADRRAWLEILGYSSAAVHSLFMFKVDSDGNAEKLAERSEFLPLWLIDNIRHSAVTIDSPVHKYNEDIQQIPPFVVNPTTFPYEDWENIGWAWIWVDFLGEKTGYDRNTFTLFSVYDSRLMPDAPDYDNGVEEFNEFYFPVQDGYQAKITNSGDIDTWQLDGIYNGNKQLFDAGGIGGTDAHKWDMSFATFKGGDFLFGIHGDALYKIGDDGNIEIVGDDLKNFRLRELKRISKAKK